MDSWHHQFLQKYSTYHQWHNYPRHPFWHWVVFSFVAIFVFNHLYTRIGDYSNEEILSLSIQTPQAQAVGNTYYVSTSGNDANQGTLSQPFRTIVKGNSVLQPGDTLYIRGGTYDEGINKSQMKSGTAAAPITVAGYPNETVLIYAFPLYFCSCNGSPAGVSYVVLDNLIFDGERYGTSGAYFGYGGNAFAPQHITLKNSTVRNHWGGQGIQVGGSYHLFSNLKVYNIGKDTFDHGFYINGGGHVTVENSEIYNIKSAGIKFGEGAMDFGIARNNIIHDFGLGQAPTSASTQGGGVGIVMSVGTTNTVAYNNLIYNNKSPADCGNCPGIQLWKGNNNQIYNNVVYNMGTHQGIMVSYMTNVTVTNNIVVGSSPNFKNEGFGGSWTLSNNLCDNAGAGCAIVGNPAFTNAGANDFHLQSSSPAINAGATLSVVTTDFDGLSRPQGCCYDIGAYEYGGTMTAIPTPTLTLTPTPTPTPTPTLPPGCFTGTSSWQFQPITSQTGKFRAEFDAKPGANNIDGVIGLSQTVSSAYTNLAVIVRFNNQGYIDARNGANYSAATAIPYTAGTNYHFRLEIDIPSHTYSIYVTPAGGSEITLGTNYAFRTEQSSISNLNYWNVISNVGNTTVCNFSISNVITTPSLSSCDLNKDTKTDILDFQLLANVILGLTSNPGGSDINKDGQTNILDTQVLANVILGKTTCP